MLAIRSSLTEGACEKVRYGTGSTDCWQLAIPAPGGGRNTTARLQCRAQAAVSNRQYQTMNLLKALATVSSMTLLSRVLGFVRDAVIARAFGAGLYTDA